VFPKTTFPYILKAETCCGKEGTLYSDFLKKEFNNQVAVKAVKIGRNRDDDFVMSLTVHPFEQVSEH
jgi:hypothetical protein